LKKSRKSSKKADSEAYGEESFYGEEDYYGEEGASESMSKTMTRSRHIQKGEEEVSDGGEDFEESQIALAE
jgi:hypothetical protein